MDGLNRMVLIALINLTKFLSSVGPYTGVIIGISAIQAWHASRKEQAFASNFWTTVFCSAVVVGPGGYFGLPWIFEFFRVKGGYLPTWHLTAQVAGGVLGILFAFIWARRVTPLLASAKSKATRRSDLERNRKTDVREIKKHLPDPRHEYNPGKYLDAKKGVFLGLDEHGRPQYIAQDLWRRSHAQLIGTSGAGKGVAAAVLLAQSLRDGEAVIVIDPKDDEWAPHVLKAEAERLGVPFRLVDLRADVPQLDLFDGATPDQLEELLVAGFSLAEKGEAADFYRIADRQAARLAGGLLAELGDGVTPQQLAAHPQIRKAQVSAAGFVGKLDELARVRALAAPFARHLSDTVRDGGCLYIIGSMRNERIKSAQRMALVRLLQLVETRDRIHSKPRPVCTFLDELKYHLSRAALEGLGAARDKGMHLVLAHQSLADLRDCPADLDGEAVIGAVVENCALRITYRVRDPETAEWLASMSGTILVDDEVRKVERNVALAEVIDGERTVRQAERYLVDQNMLLNLPPRVAVIYGGPLPVFAHICPLKAKKGPLVLSSAPAIEPVPDEEDAPAGAVLEEAPGAEVVAPVRPAAKRKGPIPSRLEELPDVDF